MNKKLLNILQTRETPIENQQIIDYLNNKLSTEKRHLIEEQEMNSGLVQDAMDGLELMKDKTKLVKMTHEINRHLHEKLRDQIGIHNNKRQWKEQNWIILSVVTVLLILTICLIMFRILHKS